MLDRGVSYRCLLAWVTGVASVLALLLGWALSSDDAGRAGLALMALACTQWVLQDSARTRRCLRASAALRDEGLRVARNL